MMIFRKINIRILQFTILLISIQSFSQVLNPVITEENLAELIDSAYLEYSKFGKLDFGKELLDYVELNEIQLKNPLHIGICHLFRGEHELELHRLKLSGQEFRKAKKIFKEHHEDEKLAVAIDNLGTIKTSFSEYDSAYYFSKRAFNLVEFTDNKYLLIDIYYNLSYRGSNLEKWEKSIYYAEQAIKIATQENVKLNRIKYMHNKIANSYIKQNKLEIAKKHLDSALSLCSDKSGPFDRAITHRNYGKYYTAKGEYKLAAESFDMVNKLMNETRKTQIDKNNKHILNDLNLKKDLIKKNKKIISNQKRVLLLSICFTTVVLFFGFLLIRSLNRQKTNIKHIKTLNNKIKQALWEIESKNTDLVDRNNEIRSLLQLNERTLFSKELKISTLSDAIQKIENEVTTLMDSKSEISNLSLLPVKRSLKSLVNENEIWEDFKIQFEKIRPGFFTNLKVEFPQLTINDLKHSAYIVSNLKSKEVAELLNVSPRSVETARYRLKKKLNIDSESGLHEFLSKV